MTVSLEEMAQIQSEIDAGRDRTTVLAAATLTDSSWQEAKLEWLEAMSGELARGRSLLLSRYGKAFVQHRARLDAQQALDDRAVSAAQAGSGAKASLVDERKIDVPSFLAKEPEIASPMSAAPITAPMVSAAPTTAPMPEISAPAHAPTGASLKETSAVDLSAIISALPLPFQGAGSSPVQKTSPSGAGPSSRATPFEPASDNSLRKPALERASLERLGEASASSANSQRTGAILQTPAPAIESEALSKSAPALGVETAALDFASIQDQVAQIIARKGRALPFEPTAANAPLSTKPSIDPRLGDPPLSNSPLPNSAAAAQAPRVSNSLAQTAFSAGNTAATPLPFATPRAAAPAHAPLDWTIERYAALSIDLATAQVPRDQVLAAYKVTSADHQALATYWQERLTDPTVGAQWKAACERYRATRPAPPKR